MLQNTVGRLSTWGFKVAERYRLGDARLLNADALKASTKYESSHDLKDLDEAITKGREAVQKVPLHHPDKCNFLYNVSRFLESRYNASGEIRDLDEAVTYTRKLLDTMPKGHTEYIMFTSNAALQLRSLYNIVGRIEDLDLAVSKSEEAALSTPNDSSDRAIVYHNWSAILSSRYAATRQTKDLDNCISTSRLVVGKLATPSHPNRIKFLINLASCLRQRFDNDGALQDIADAIEAATEVVGLARPSHPELATWLNYLAIYHSKRFSKTENLADTNYAIQYGKEAIEVTPKDDVLNQAKRFSALSLYYSDRFQHVNDTDDLQLAVILSRKAVNHFPSDHLERPTVIHNLTSCLRARYSRLGDMEDLEEAIRKGQEAVDLTPATEVDDLQRFQCNLSLDFHARFNRAGAAEDLEHAIRLLRKAMEAAPKDFVLLNNLLLFLSNRWERYHERTDIEEAIQVGQEVWHNVPLDSAKRRIIMGNLAMAFRHRYECLKSIDDLEEAIRICCKMLDSSFQKLDPTHALHVLSSCLHLRYQKIGLKENLELAVITRSKALDLMPIDHPDRATALWSLLQLRLAQFDASNNQEYIDKAIQEGMEAASMENASFHARVFSAYWAGGIAMHAKRWVEGDQLLSRAIRMMPNLTTRSLTRDDQQFAITRLINISSLAVSASISAKRSAEESLELLEAGRGVIASLTISSRNGVSDLDKVDPKIRLEYERLRERVNATMPSTMLRNDTLLHNDTTLRKRETQSAISSRGDAIRDLTKLEERIRRLPGLARFQLSPAANDLMELAAEGPIVSFNVTIYRSDVLLVTLKEVRVLQLLDLKYSEMEENAVKLLGRGKITAGKPRTKPMRNKQLHKILQWIWDVAVGQALQELGLLTCESPKQPARIWWLTSGFLGSLPLHAAGYYGKGATRNALHHVISSYIPSFKALAYARERRLKTVAKAEQRGLIVTMSKTANMKDLKVEEEARSVQENVGQLTDQTPLILERPTRQEVIERLAESTIVHFACHGSSDPYNPSNGGLFLQDGSLTIRDLGPISLPLAQIAYLSACSTANNAALHLIEEGIQVATGFQLMGFPHVVGTLWEASNIAAVEVAKGFYRILAFQINDSGSLVEYDVVATALHHATKALVEKEGVEDAISWAPFIHIGA